MSEHIGNVPISPTKTRDANPSGIYDPLPIQKVDGAVVDRHRGWGFLGRLNQLPGGVGDLQNEESSACECLGRECGCPGTIDPKPVRIPAVSLYNQWIFLASDVVKGPI